METFSILFALSVVAITLVSWHFIELLWKKPKKLEHQLKSQGFGGNNYRLINGDIDDITQMAQSALSKPMSSSSHDLVPRLAPFVKHLIDQHGENTFMWHGRTPKLNITNPELLREIFTKYDIFRKNPLGKRTTFGLVLRDGEDWAKVRRIINPAFHIDKLKNMLPMMEVSVDAMLRQWDELIKGKEFVEVDVYSYLSSVAGDVISRTSFGSSYEQGNRLFQLENECIRLKIQEMGSVRSIIPGWRYLPTRTNQKIKELDGEIKKLVTSLVESRKTAIKEGDNTFKEDLLSIMLESNEKDIKENGVGITSAELIDECRLFLWAGKETTASLLTWTLVLLTQHQDWQNKARDEVLQHFGKDTSPTFEGLNSLKIVNMILQETLRFYPPIPTLARVISTDTKLKNFSLSSGMEINIPTLIVHRDPKIWGSNANEYDPSRFANGVSNAFNNVQGSFCPFGGGPRTCIGQNFALIEAKLVLAKILQRFTFQLSPSYVHAPIQMVGILPKYGVPLILYKI